MSENRLEVYRELCSSYRAIDDFRAKLLAFLPFATGGGIFLLLNKDIASGEFTRFFAPIGVFGFLITLGLFAYEIYGIKKCGALILAGRQIESWLQTVTKSTIRQGMLMTDSNQYFETLVLKRQADYLAPDGSEIRLLPRMKGGSLCHCTLPADQTSSPVAHQHVEEIWYVLEGEGEVWRKGEGAGVTVRVSAGTSLTIPPRTAFQFRNTGAGPLCILIVTMPSWPGPEEAEPATGVWPVTVNAK